MKILSFLGLFLFFQSSNKIDLKTAFESHSDLYQGPLHGKVKSIELFMSNGDSISTKVAYTTKFDTLKNVVQFITNNTYKINFLYVNNKLVKEESFKLGKMQSVTRYRYKEDNLIEIVSQDMGGKNINQELYYYKDKRLSKITHYFNKKISSVTNYTYINNNKKEISDSSNLGYSLTTVEYIDSQNKIIHHKVLRTKDGEKISDTFFIYDERGNEIEYKSNYLYRKSSYLQYDYVGNWTKKKVYDGKDTFIHYRKISYYK